MKLMNITNPDKFMEVIDMCKGKVELIGPDIRVNLKSKMSQFLALAELFNADVDLGEFEIVAHEFDDVQLLIQYLVGRV